MEKTNNIKDILGIFATVIIIVFIICSIFWKINKIEKRLWVMESNIKDLQKTTKFLMVENDKTIEIIIETMDGKIKDYRIINRKNQIENNSS